MKLLNLALFTFSATQVQHVVAGSSESTGIDHASPAVDIHHLVAADVEKAGINVGRYMKRAAAPKSTTTSTARTSVTRSETTIKLTTTTTKAPSTTLIATTLPKTTSTKKTTTTTTTSSAIPPGATLCTAQNPGRVCSGTFTRDFGTAQYGMTPEGYCQEICYLTSTAIDGYKPGYEGCLEYRVDSTTLECQITYSCCWD